MPKIRVKKRNKVVWVYPLFLSFDLEGLEKGFNLGHSPVRWAFGIGLGILFLAGVFGPLLLFGDTTIMCGVILFWFTLLLGWPKKITTSVQIYYFVILQILFCTVFILIMEWTGEYIYRKFGYWTFRILFTTLSIPVWLRLSQDAYRWIEKKKFKIFSK